VVELCFLPISLLTVLGDCQASKSDTGTGAWWLIHLTEDQSNLGLAVKLNDTSFLHFMVEIVALASTLANTSEHRETTMGLGDVVLLPCQRCLYAISSCS
jgi:hypothetical protein